LLNNNASVEEQSNPTADITEEEWDRIVTINLRSVFLCLKYEIPLMRQYGGGAIVKPVDRRSKGALPLVATCGPPRRTSHSIPCASQLAPGRRTRRPSAEGRCARAPDTAVG
jgi:NAD(P)-dependent dehydrogenase (short-subunit alcohol dehydrogenase family)